MEAVTHLNESNLVHRDIKPDNIMFKKGENGMRVKLIDFGFCADFTDKSKKSLIRDKSGTACYLAPELIGMNYYKVLYNEKVDIFSIGIILYEMLT